ncbi:Mrp/NBP35 family ATP-binding protein [Roseiterribacter gracilis]|uniref:Iron-sulfur cluster carrier protein n=1 Tax=Roseiterribacter gracilis TaxID=2812848 RepID=A0A8S8XLK0_9PROT|nr:iron-sulfur cluster carrier protein [Rhodospirillales bacterium TMPK1]
MESPSSDQVRTLLARFFDPAQGLGATIAGVTIKDGRVSVAIEINPARAAAFEKPRAEAEAAIAALPGIERASVVLTAATAPTAAQAAHTHAHGHSHAPAASQQPQLPPKRPLEGVRHVIAVASGKGGVGKSTTAANLALALAGLGQKVGVLDADIYGPSQHRILGLAGKPELTDNKQLEPKRAFGLKAMTIGLLVPEDQAMIWRGPMVQGALNQLLREVAWAPLDILVIDMPPGTGDAQLTISQQAPLSGAVVVSTPQDLALIDATRAVSMFKKVAIPILGVVENMSTYICPNCGHEAHIFGHGGAHDEAMRLGIDFLGEIPLHADIRRTSDEGTPIMIEAPDGPHAAAYRAIAERVLAKLEGGAGVKAPPKISIS